MATRTRTKPSIGQVAQNGGNKVMHMAVAEPPGYVITGVRVGYEKTGAQTFISQIRLAQVKNPPATASVILDDGTDHVSPGPVYVDSAATKVDPPPVRSCSACA